MKSLNQPIRNARVGAWVLLLGFFFTPAVFGQTTITNIPTLGGTVVSATALNNRGQVVGFSRTPGDAAQHAFLFSGGLLYDLGTLGGALGVAWGVNNAGQVVGDASTPSDADTHAFLFNGQAMTDLGTLGGGDSSGVAINDSGHATGNSGPNAFLYSGGPLLNLGTLGGSYSAAVGINNLGQVTGSSETTNGEQHAFFYTANVIYDLGTLGGPYSSAAAINDSGQVVGESYTTNSQIHAFLLGNGTLLDVGTLGGTYSTAYAINRFGQVIGDASTSDDAEYHGFFYHNGTITDLGTLGGGASTAAALNNLGQVVGDSTDGSGTGVPFLWQNGVMMDLNSLLPPNSGWQLMSASFINDAGQVVGYGSYNGNFSWYLLTAKAANRPPVANAGADQTVECPAAVTLDGSKSSDPDQDPLSFEWREGATLLGTGATISGQLPVGSHLITLTVTDPGNLSSQASVTITVTDTTPPVVACPAPVAAPAVANCQAAVPDLLVGISASDNCTPANQLAKTQSPSAGTLVGPGVYSITLTVTDAAGNANSCTTTFTVTDTTSPVVACPAPVTAPAAANCQTAVPDLLAGMSASDNCTPANQLAKTQSPPAGTLVGPGVYSITLTATDAAGNASSCTTTFTVTDTTPPVVACPAPATAPAGANCQAAVPDLLAGMSASDNCTAANALAKTQSPPAGTLVGVGPHPITLTVTDAAGNASSCTTTFTVTDSTPPVVNCPAPVTAPAAANCQAAVPDLLAGTSASDNCTAASALAKTQSPAAGTLVGVGPHPITLTVTDAAGNASSCTTTFTVTDSTPPVVNCPAALTVRPNQNGQAAVPDLLAGLSASDNCTPATQLAKTQNPPAGTLVGVGVHPITLTVTDAAGNVSSCNTPLTVADSTPLVVTCPAAMTARADQNGQAAVPDLLARIHVSDHGTPAAQLVKIQDPPAGTLLGPGVHAVTVTVTDASGNAGSCTTTFTVADKTPPVVSCPAPRTVPADANGQAAVPDLLASLSASDNCTPADQLAKTQNPPAGTLLGLGSHPITVIVTDAAGNTTTCRAHFKVVDSTAPVIQALAATPNTISQANGQMVPVTVTVSASDNCDSAPVSKIISITSSDPVKGPGDKTAQDWKITGPLTAHLLAELSPGRGDRVYTITVRCKDAAGNSSTKDVTVVVTQPGHP